MTMSFGLAAPNPMSHLDSRPWDWLASRRMELARTSVPFPQAPVGVVVSPAEPLRDVDQGLRTRDGPGQADPLKVAVGAVPVGSEQHGRNAGGGDQ
jgi:hypothetical protein